MGVKLLSAILFSFMGHAIIAQVPNGPGGVGNTTGTSSLRLWLDASDLNADGNYGNNPANNTLVSAWNDKSGYAYNLTSSGTAQPTYNTTGTYNAVNFLGNGANLDNMSNATAVTLVPGTLFYAMNASDAGNNSNVLFDDNTVSLRLEQHNNTNRVGYTRYGVADYSSGIASPYGTASIVSYMKAAASNNLQIKVNNSSATVNVASTTAGIPINRIGRTTSPNDRANHNSMEIIAHNVALNTAQQKIVENYLSAKYGGISIPTDLYAMDNPANGNYDYDVAGIGRDDAANLHNDARGTGIVRVNNPSSLGNGDYFIWGHDNAALAANNNTDVPAPVLSRFVRIWRPSHTGNVGTFDISFDLTGLGSVTASDLRLLIDMNNNGQFIDETVGGGGIISGAVAQGSNVYAFTGITINDALRFTLGTIDPGQTPLPIDLLSFSATPVGKNVKVEWSTATETNNDHFHVERSADGSNFQKVATVHTKANNGNSNHTLQYLWMDHNPLAGLSYYRLKEVDQNGASKTFNTVQIDMGQNQEVSVNIFPNPNSGEFTLDLQGFDSSSPVQVTIVNVLGEVVHTETLVQSSAGTTRFVISLNKKLAAGQYICQVTSDEVQKQAIIFIE